MADLTTDLLGLHLRNPVMPAAGPPGRDGAALLACAAGGAGAPVAQTISPRAAQRARPRRAAPTGRGGIGGPALKPLAVRCVRAIAGAVDLPVIGVGGVARGT